MENKLQTVNSKQLVTTTLPQLLTTYSPSECMRSLSKCNTLTKAIQSNTHTLSAMVRDHGPQKIEAYIKLWLIDLNESLDLRRPLKQSQIDFQTLRWNKD